MSDKTEIKTEHNLEEFKKLVRKAIFLASSEEIYFNSIPNSKWKSIFETNFSSNLSYAQRVILSKSREIESKDTIRVDREKFKIHNIDKATKIVVNSINDNSPILFITDFDNDGSLSQAIINEYLAIDIKAAKNMQVHYAQTVNGNSNRGFTVDLVDKIVEMNNINPDKKFLIITADNGINSVEEQLKIQAKYPEAELIVTDHHNPDPEMVIKENSKAIIFNPHYKPTEFFKEFNISGATTVGVLLRSVLKNRFTDDELITQKRHLDNIQKLSKVSNLLDYVKTDPADKPEKDYIISKFLTLQPLLNINNSISKIITGEISSETIQSIKEKIPNLNSDLLYSEAKNIHIQNKMAEILLKIFNANHNTNIEKKKSDSTNLHESTELDSMSEDINTTKKKNDEYLDLLILKELNNPTNYFDKTVINSNFIEQLRPIIFGLSADDEKNTFMEYLNQRMINVYLSIKESEKKMAEELRNGEVITKSKLENSVIAYTDPNILTVFNRKFLNKVYNDENPGFSLTLDSLDKGKVSGSFRSLYDISDILKNKAKLEKHLKVKIETPGHERAAGFIIKSLNPTKNPITKDTIESVNVFINNSISKIKEKEVKNNNDFILTDLGAITLIDRINRVVRGNISHFDRIVPLLKITPDTIWTDSYTTEQYTMDDIKNNRKYGYITIDINFHGDTVIVPVELIRKIVNKDYKDYLSLNYMDGGVFMAERVIQNKDVKNLIDLRDKNEKSNEIIKVWNKDFKDKNHVDLTREQIKDNPFFKYHDYGRLNFDLFERMVIGIIDSNQIDTLAVFDVEANGFANAKLMNLGSMNYTINPDSGKKIESSSFNNRLYATQRGDEYLLSETEIKFLREIKQEDLESLNDDIKKILLVKHIDISETEDEFSAHISSSVKYYFHPSMDELLSNKKLKELPFEQVKNYLDNNTTEEVTYNREIQATMLAYLVKDKDFRVPQQMTNLTGITQDILKTYGKTTDEVDTLFSDFYKDKNILFGAHNTPYDARVLRANTPKIYQTLKNNQIYDSALFSKEKKLAYDDVKVSSLEGIVGVPKNVYFYNNTFSDFCLSKFIEKNENGYFPDRTNKFLLGIENEKYLLVDKEKHEIIQIDATKEEMTSALRENNIPNVSIKYSVEKLSQQWMIHALLLSDEKFSIQHVDLENIEYAALSAYKQQFVFFQNNYHFDSDAGSNLDLLGKYYNNLGSPIQIDEDKMKIVSKFIDEFLNLNKDIQQKFSDSWIYKAVLEIKEPDHNDDITNDLVDLVQFQTSIPKDKIVNIFKEALAFKKKYKIDHIIQHESHVNGPWETDVKGDIAFEDKLTLSLLAQRHYDPYHHNVEGAVKEFNKYSLKARYAFEKADKLSEELAHDSYSFRQGLFYDRAEPTTLIKGIQERENKLKDNSKEQLVILKLDNDILNQDTQVVAIIKKDISLSREQLEKDSKKLSFICANEQLKYSIKNGDVGEDAEYLEPILQSNDEISLQYKEDLSNRYRYIEFNKKAEQIKDVLEFIEKKLNGGDEKKSKRSKKVNTHQIGQDGFKVIEDIVNKYIETANRTAHTCLKDDNISEARVALTNLIINSQETSLENALKNGDLNFRTFKEVSDVSFLKEVNINRQKPVKLLLEKFSHLRLINNFIENNRKSLSDNYEDTNQNNLKESIKKP
jgi:single-stranded DNA-specific DHH superfamily exonuclease